MLLETIKQFNWVDIFVVTILFRISYIAIKNGFSHEIFKLLGTVISIYLSLHYYTVLSDFIARLIFVKKVPLFLDFLIFMILAILGYFIFVLLRRVFYRFIKMEAIPNLSKWGGLVLGIVRGILFTALIMFMLTISSISYLKNSVSHSYLGRRFFKIAPKAYTWIWNSFASKFMVNEQFNESVSGIIQEDFTKKK